MSGGLTDPDLLAGRLFFAVPIPSPSRAPLAAVHPSLAEALPEARLTAPSGWHLTLAFLGHVRPEHSSDVVRAGEAAAGSVRQRAARLHLEGAGAFPSTRRGRVLWAGVAGDVPLLQGLAATLSAACREAGLRYEERELHPHLTLARLQRPAPIPEALVGEVAGAAAASPPWEARELCCYRSILRRTGARYEVVRTFAFGGGG